MIGSCDWYKLYNNVYGTVIDRRILDQQWLFYGHKPVFLLQIR